MDDILMNDATETLECGLCGANHSSSSCSDLEITSHIYDNIVPSKARLTIPNELKIETMADGNFAVLAGSFVKKGSKFGPFIARKLFTLNPIITFPLKIFNSDQEDFSEYYLDTSDENECNWMIFVNPASTVEEQNLTCYQEKEHIFYVTIRDITEGEHLKVWYSSHYAQKMNQKLLAPQYHIEEELQDNKTLDLSKLLVKQQKIMIRDSWNCKFCSLVESDVIKFAKHILDHYTLQLRKVCEICREMFNTRKGLKKHVKVVHNSLNSVSIEKTLEKSNVNCQPQPSINDSVIGGPLLNNILNDSLDNSNIILQHTELNNFDLSSNNLLLETDNLNVDNLLNENVKELDHFNFDLDECHEQFVCDVCLKSFSNLRLLVQHLKSHTGKFACQHCLKVFARNESLKVHPCCNNNSPKYQCDLCQKKFFQIKYLQRHSKKYLCEKCKKRYQSSTELKEHNCAGIPNEEKQTFSCITCNKTFYRELYLKKHMKTHGKRVAKENKKRADIICEVCAQVFESKKCLQLHQKSHKEPTYSCTLCDKKFHRKDVLASHKLTHSDAKFKCGKCSLTFRFQKNLAKHELALHSTNNSSNYECSECSKLFSTQSNLVQHRKIHSKVCLECKMEFPSVELKEKHRIEHFSTYYKCNFCLKIMKLRSSLFRHIRNHHPEEDVNKIKPLLQHRTNLTNTEAVTENDIPKIDESIDKAKENEIISYLLKESTNVQEHIPSNVENTMDTYNPENLDSRDFENISFGETVPNNMKERNDVPLLDFNDLDLSSFDLQTNVNNREVCLSMPDLLEGDQEITFGQNAYILENGNVVEPQEEGKVIVYVLDQKYQNS